MVLVKSVIGLKVFDLYKDAVFVNSNRPLTIEIENTLLDENQAKS